MELKDLSNIEIDEELTVENTYERPKDQDTIEEKSIPPKIPNYEEH